MKILQSLKDFVDLEMNYLFLSFRIKRREIKNLYNSERDFLFQAKSPTE